MDNSSSINLSSDAGISGEQTDAYPSSDASEPMDNDSLNNATLNNEAENNEDIENEPIVWVEDEITSTGGEGSDTAEVGKKLIVIDAGHQKKPNYKEEPIGPGAEEAKPKVSTGTRGISSGVEEYILTLVIAFKVKEELIDRGYDVIMIRETHDVNLSNRERAEIANESGADIFIRIHADGSTDQTVSGTSTLYPSSSNKALTRLSATYA